MYFLSLFLQNRVGLGFNALGMFTQVGIETGELFPLESWKGAGRDVWKGTFGKLVEIPTTWVKSGLLVSLNGKLPKTKNLIESDLLRFPSLIQPFLRFLESIRA